MLNALVSTLFLFSLISPSAQALNVRIIDLRRASSQEASKADQIVAALNAIMNSEEFKNRVLNFRYQGIYQFANNNGLTNQQIYDRLMAGEEELPKPTKANQEADLYISMYDPPWYRRSGLAFTYPNDRYMYIYRQYFTRGSLSDLTNTFIHEWTHKLGFVHDYYRTKRRPYSVPYGIGSIIEGIVSGWARDPDDEQGTKISIPDDYSECGTRL